MFLAKNDLRPSKKVILASQTSNSQKMTFFDLLDFEDPKMTFFDLKNGQKCHFSPPDPSWTS